jgi:predicted flap endonuclease-1-like 5' DNA nuclease/outer membrane murein-binding lipoprotein Lpp
MMLNIFCSIPWYLTWLIPALLGFGLAWSLWSKYKGVASTLEGKISGLNKDVADLNGQITQLKGNVSDKAHRISELVGDVAFANGRMNEAIQELETIKTHGSSTNSSTSGPTISALNTEIDALKRQVEAAKAESAKYQSEVNSYAVAALETKSQNDELESLKMQLSNAKEESAKWQAESQNSSSLSSSTSDELNSLKQQLEAAITESNQWKLKAQTSIIAAISDTTQAEATIGSLSPYEKISDTNLQIIEGIGPKVDEILKKNGINNFSDLSSKSTDEIKAILIPAGSLFAAMEPSSWIKEAQLATQGKWNDLVNLQKADGSDSKLEKYMITNGFIKTFAQDDLKIVEGIGPKIETLLHNAGIKTWRALANTSKERMQQILDEGGPNFQISDPTSWAKQAELAADGKFDELKTYQDFLQAGRE